MKVVLIDGRRLAKLMFDHKLGCTAHSVYELKKIDNDYFEPGSMIN
jgi:restriction system protein